MSASRFHTLAIVVAALAMSVACAGTESVDTGGDEMERLMGLWSATLLTPVGELPFALRIDPRGDELAGVLISAGAETRVQSVTRRDLVATFMLSDTGSSIVAKMSTRGDSMAGYWSWSVAGEPLQLAFRATRSEAGPSQRRRAGGTVRGSGESPGGPQPESVAGTWDVQVKPAEISGRPESPGSPQWRQAELVQQGHRITGTLSGADGIQLPIEGEFRGRTLRLYYFGGEAALLCQGSADRGGSLEGECWTALSGPATWTARRQAP